MDKDTVIQKLEECLAGIPDTKKRGVSFVEAAEFQAWKESITKWLKLGCPHTQDQLATFKSLSFHVLRLRRRGETHDAADQERYEKDCDHTVYLLKSAIENLQLDLIPQSEAQDHPVSATRELRSVTREGVNIGQAGTVILGDGNVVANVDSITISDFMNALEREINAKVTDKSKRHGLIQTLRTLSSNPTVAQIFGQTLGQFLRSAFGG